MSDLMKIRDGVAVSDKIGTIDFATNPNPTAADYAAIGLTPPPSVSRTDIGTIDFTKTPNPIVADYERLGLVAPEGTPTVAVAVVEPLAVTKPIEVSLQEREASWFSEAAGAEFFPDTVKVGNSDDVGGPIGKGEGAYFIGEGDINMGGNAPDRKVKIEYFIAKNKDGGFGGIYWREPGQDWREGQYKYLPDQKTITKVVCEGRGCDLREDDLNAAVAYLREKGWISTASTTTEGAISRKSIQGDPMSGKDSPFGGTTFKAGTFYTPEDLGVTVEKTDGGTWYKWKSGDGNYYEGLWANNKFADNSQIQPNIFKVNGTQVASSEFEFTPTPLNATDANVKMWTERLAIKNTLDGKAFPYIPSTSALINNTDRIYWFSVDQSPLTKPSKNFDDTAIAGKQKEVVYAGDFNEHPDVLGKNPRIPISELGSLIDSSIGTGRIFAIDLSGKSWCNPCKNFGPTVDALASSSPSDSVQYIYLSVDDMYDSRNDFNQAMELVGKYGITGNVSFPTMVYIQDGKVVGGNLAQGFLTMPSSDYVASVNSFIAGAGSQVGTAQQQSSLPFPTITTIAPQAPAVTIQRPANIPPDVAIRYTNDARSSYVLEYKGEMYAIDNVDSAYGKVWMTCSGQGCISGKASPDLDTQIANIRKGDYAGGGQLDYMAYVNDYKQYPVTTPDVVATVTPPAIAPITKPAGEPFDLGKAWTGFTDLFTSKKPLATDNVVSTTIPQPIEPAVIAPITPPTPTVVAGSKVDKAADAMIAAFKSAPQSYGIDMDALSKVTPDTFAKNMWESPEKIAIDSGTKVERPALDTLPSPVEEFVKEVLSLGSAQTQLFDSKAISDSYQVAKKQADDAGMDFVTEDEYKDYVIRHQPSTSELGMLYVPFEYAIPDRADKRAYEMAGWEKFVYPLLDATIVLPVVGIGAKLAKLGLKNIPAAKIAILGGKQAVIQAEKEAIEQLAKANVVKMEKNNILKQAEGAYKAVVDYSKKKGGFLDKLSGFDEAAYKRVRDIAMKDAEKAEDGIKSLTKGRDELSKLVKLANSMPDSAIKNATVDLVQSIERGALQSRTAFAAGRFADIGTSAVISKITIDNWDYLQPYQRVGAIILAALPLGLHKPILNVAENVLDPWKIPVSALKPRKVGDKQVAGQLYRKGEGTLRLVMDGSIPPTQARDTVASLIKQLVEEGKDVAQAPYGVKTVSVKGTGFQDVVGPTIFSGSPVGDIWASGTGRFGVKTELEKFVESITGRKTEFSKEFMDELEKGLNSINMTIQDGKIVSYGSKMPLADYFKLPGVESEAGLKVEGKEGGAYFGPSLYTQFTQQAAFGAKGKMKSGILLGIKEIAGLDEASSKLYKMNIENMEKAAKKIFNGIDEKNVDMVVEGFKDYRNFMEFESVVTNATQIQRVQNWRSRLADKLKLNRGEYYTRGKEGRIELLQMYIEGGSQSPYTIAQLYKLKGLALRNALEDIFVGLGDRMKGSGGEDFAQAIHNKYDKAMREYSDAAQKAWIDLNKSNIEDNAKIVANAYDLGYVPVVKPNFITELGLKVMKARGVYISEKGKGVRIAITKDVGFSKNDFVGVIVHELVHDKMKKDLSPKYRSMIDDKLSATGNTIEKLDFGIVDSPMKDSKGNIVKYESPFRETNSIFTDLNEAVTEAYSQKLMGETKTANLIDNPLHNNYGYDLVDAEIRRAYGDDVANKIKVATKQFIDDIPYKDTYPTFHQLDMEIESHNKSLHMSEEEKILRKVLADNNIDNIDGIIQNYAHNKQNLFKLISKQESRDIRAKESSVGVVKPTKEELMQSANKVIDDRVKKGTISPEEAVLYKKNIDDAIRASRRRYVLPERIKFEIDRLTILRPVEPAPRKREEPERPEPDRIEPRPEDRPELRGEERPKPREEKRPEPRTTTTYEPPRPPRPPEPPRPPRPPITPEGPRTPRVPEVPRYPRTTIPKRIPGIIVDPRLTSSEEDIQPLDIASIVWKQGWYFYKLKPPYTQKDLVGSKKPFAGTKIHKGLASAYKSVAMVDGVTLPKHIELDLGIQDIVLEADDKGKDVRIYYKADLKQNTTAGPVTGEFAKYGTRRTTVRRSSGGGTPLLGGLK